MLIVVFCLCCTQYACVGIIIPREASSLRETMSEAIVPQVSMPERTCCQGQLWVRWVFHRCRLPERLRHLRKLWVSEVSVPHGSMPQEALSQREIECSTSFNALRGLVAKGNCEWGDCSTCVNALRGLVAKGNCEWGECSTSVHAPSGLFAKRNCEWGDGVDALCGVEVLFISSTRIRLIVT